MKIITGIAVATALLTMLTLNVKAAETVTVTVGMQTKKGDMLHKEAKWTVRCKRKPTVISYGKQVKITGIAGRECIAWAATESHRGWIAVRLKHDSAVWIRMTKLK